MLIWGYKFFSRKLCDDSHSLWLIFTAWSSQVSFFAKWSKVFYIFTKLFVIHDTQIIPFWVSAVLSALSFFSFKSRMARSFFVSGFAQNLMLLQHHFHFLKSCNFSTICIFFILQSICQVCVSGQRWTPGLAEGVWAGHHIYRWYISCRQCYGDSSLP